MNYIQGVLFQVHVSKCPLDISSYVFNRHLKLSMSQTKLLIFPQKPSHSAAFLISIYGPITHLLVILVCVCLQNMYKYDLNVPALLALWSDPFPKAARIILFTHKSDTHSPT